MSIEAQAIVHSHSQKLDIFQQGKYPETAGEAAMDLEITMVCVFSGGNPTCHVSHYSIAILSHLFISLTALWVSERL